jgi:hypothetical protein
VLAEQTADVLFGCMWMHLHELTGPMSAGSAALLVASSPFLVPIMEKQPILGSYDGRAAHFWFLLWKSSPFLVPIMEKQPILGSYYGKAAHSCFKLWKSSAFLVPNMEKQRIFGSYYGKAAHF